MKIVGVCLFPVDLLDRESQFVLFIGQVRWEQVRVSVEKNETVGEGKTVQEVVPPRFTLPEGWAGQGVGFVYIRLQR